MDLAATPRPGGPSLLPPRPGIAQAAGQQSTASEEIARSVSGISSFSQDLTKGMDDFSHTVQGMAGHVRELSTVIGGLEEQACTSSAKALGA